MKARRSPARGPLLTFALMLGSIAAVVAVAHFFEAPPQTPDQTVAVSASSTAASTTARQ
jgi:hypothetical protein